jgi:3-deoxy-manno-octulosonate cytidylyltransferase (CMP-KDO synthetase)
MFSADTAIIIPARYSSTRFPGKPLALLAGKMMLARVWANASAAMLGADGVFIATDDDRIEAAAKSWGANVIRTSPRCENGSERSLEASNALPASVKFIINLQGDSPLVPPTVIRELIEFRRRQTSEIVTSAIELSAEYAAEVRRTPERWGAGTYVTIDQNSRALYFSRYPIPFIRDRNSDAPLLKHVGIYGYTRESLAQYVNLAPSKLEDAEKLEQLRALEGGFSISVALCDLGGRTLVSVDTLEDLRRAAEVIQIEGELLG